MAVASDCLGMSGYAWTLNRNQAKAGAVDVASVCLFVCLFVWPVAMIIHPFVTGIDPSSDSS